MKGEESRSTDDKFHLDFTVPELAIFARSIWESKALNKRRTTVIGLVRAMSEIVELKTTGVKKISEDSLNHYASGQWPVTRTNMENVAKMIDDMKGWLTKESKGFKGGKLSNITK
ncbi:MAG: hypothetical protein IPJ06_17260 [Saprospiraceae bacterium]|nr:hypothetical protein [Saprospiraceae bacterium]